jgi:hypothetical protein
MFFLDNNQDTQNSIDFTNLKRIFVNIVGEGFKGKLSTSQIQSLISTFYKFESQIVAEEYVKQFHILYLIGHIMHKYNYENLGLNNTEFYNDFYFPNIISILSSHLRGARRILNSIVTTTYVDVRDKCQDVVEFYLVFFNRDHTIIKNDILNIFLNTLFLDNDPVEIDDIKDYYSSNFRYLIYSYLKNKTSGLLTFEVDPTVIREDHMISVSARYKIYEDGIRVTQIQELCDKPNTQDRVLQNYNKLKSNVITNELQKFYLYATNKTATNDNKISILSTLNNEEQLDKVKSKLPLIYKLLRAIHINTKDNVIDDNFRQLIYKSIYEVLYLEFEKNISKDLAVSLANNISKKMTHSLTFGQYIDPLTMEPVSVNTHGFVIQLKQFLEILVKNVAV